MKGAISIGGTMVGPGYPCRVVAEIGANHNGSLHTARCLVHGSAEAGADFIKFQLYTPDELVRARGDGPAPEPWSEWGSLSDVWTMGQTPLKWLPTLVRDCRWQGVPWFASVFGYHSLTEALAYRSAAIKLSAWDEDGFALGVLGSKLVDVPIICSTRGTEHVEGADITLWCPEGYPQDYGAFRWPDEGVVRHGLDGLSYHGTSEHPTAILVEGARTGYYESAHMVEVHVQLDDEPSILDAHSSLTISQLRKVCSA